MGTIEGIRRPTAKAQRLRREATPAERALWRRLSGSKLGYKFSRQMPIGPYICDFMCRSHMLVVELDGYSHDLSVAEDRARDRFIRVRGFSVLRFSNQDVMANIEGVVTAISAALASPPPAPPASGRGA